MYESSSCVHSSTGRTFLVLFFVFATSSGVLGCRWFQDVHPKNPFAPEPVCVLSADATKEEIVAHINAQASRLNAWKSSQVAIRLKQPGMPAAFNLSADMAVESPLNFRLRAKSLVGEEADFGSNRERFWFWVKRADYPYVMTAAHEDLGLAQQQLPIPFEPQWVMEVFGVTPIDPSRYDMVNVNQNRVDLISQQTSASGQPVTKVIGVDLCSGFVVEHSLFDASNQLIARATMGNHTFSSDGIAIPYHMTLEWPRAGTRMTLDFRAVEINPAYTPETIWQLPNIAYVHHLGR